MKKLICGILLCTSIFTVGCVSTKDYHACKECGKKGPEDEVIYARSYGYFHSCNKYGLHTDDCCCLARFITKVSN